LLNQIFPRSSITERLKHTPCDLHNNSMPFIRYAL